MLLLNMGKRSAIITIKWIAQDFDWLFDSRNKPSGVNPVGSSVVQKVASPIVQKDE